MLEKLIYDLIKVKLVDPYKKNPLGKIEVKTIKDNKIRLDIKSSNKAFFEELNQELSITQQYISLNINEKDHFLVSGNVFSLKYFLQLFPLISHDIYKLDENSFSVRVIGKHQILEKLNILIHEYLESQNKKHK